jgi:23S rRNA C2498 (ribose-2'-O)-methylase RlmM
MTKPIQTKSKIRKKSSWHSFYKKTANAPASKTLTKALSLFEAQPQPRKERFAIDLGCGAGRDTFELLRQGWKVLAVDNRAQAIRWMCVGQVVRDTTTIHDANR